MVTELTASRSSVLHFCPWALDPVVRLCTWLTQAHSYCATASALIFDICLTSGGHTGAMRCSIVTCFMSEQVYSGTIIQGDANAVGHVICATAGAVSTRHAATALVCSYTIYSMSSRPQIHSARLPGPAS